MRILIVGAGAVGGYFGARLLEQKRDVTFLVRHRRAVQLQKAGLVVHSPTGDIHVPSPQYLLSDEITAGFDLIVVACKSYDLADTMESFAPAVRTDTLILPLLNGMRHLDQLAQRFGDQRVLGGLCMISSVMEPDGVISHLNDTHILCYGERNGTLTPRIQAITDTLCGVKFEARAAANILQQMWEKWVFIATAAGITCLMRASVGDIATAGAVDLTHNLFDECAAIATREGFQPSASSAERSRSILTDPGSALTASMLRDIERGATTEADHIIGDLLRRGAEHQVITALLRICYAHVKSYEVRRMRTANLRAT